MNDRDILNAYEEKKIIIEPFNRNQLNNTSYNVRLGENFYREKKTKEGIFNYMTKEGVDDAYEKGECMTKKELCDIYKESGFENLKDDIKIILLKPNESILAETIEFIGGVYDITANMACRSSYGRIGITACFCAGWGDVGYYNRWTMEIKNKNEKNIIPLFVGESIAQISFVKFNTLPFKNYTENGNYSNKYHDNNIVDIEKLTVNYDPEMMLPKLYKKDAKNVLKNFL